MIKKPDPVDIHVGQRVRERRRMMSMSQTVFGGHLGVTFQQVQKYEGATNRIGSSRLFRMSTALGVPVGYFFEGLETIKPAKQDGGNEQDPLDGLRIASIAGINAIRNEKSLQGINTVVSACLDAQHFNNIGQRKAKPHGDFERHLNMGEAEDIGIRDAAE